MVLTKLDFFVMAVSMFLGDRIYIPVYLGDCTYGTVSMALYSNGVLGDLGDCIYGTYGPTFLGKIPALPAPVHYPFFKGAPFR